MFGSNVKPDAMAIMLQKLNIWLEGTFTLPVQSVVAMFTPYDKSYDFEKDYVTMKKMFALFPWLESRQIIVIYSNKYGRKFRNFAEVTSNSKEKNLRFVDLHLRVQNYYDVDDHPNARGHEKIAEILAGILH
ncbi:MAG: hypothetical protein HGB15_03445 [Chlorobaculum sp.]|nr:hypothetical protein [Chlorobaculum sp.]